MPLDDLRHTVEGHARIPNLLRIDHDRRAPLAEIQASSLVGANAMGEAAPLELSLEQIPDLGRALGGAGAAGIIGRALVHTHEAMPLVPGHENLLSSRSPVAPRRPRHSYGRPRRPRHGPRKPRSEPGAAAFPAPAKKCFPTCRGARPVFAS